LFHYCYALISKLWDHQQNNNVKLSQPQANSSRNIVEAQLELMQNVQDSLSVLIAGLPIQYSATINKLGLIQQHLKKGTDFKSKWTASWGIELHTEFGNRLNGINNQFLGINEAICSKNGYYFLTYQADGNLVIYERLKEGRAKRWSTNTSGKLAYRAIMQDDGNFVVYGNKDLKTSKIWASESRGNPQTYLQLEENGNLVIYNANKILWQSYSIDIK
jgi:WD40 repeat protein